MIILMLDLPTDLWLQILSYLPIREILSLGQTSRAWKTFIRDYEDTVYHALATLHDFVKPRTRMQECKGKDAFSFLEDVASWKELVQEHYKLEMRWAGKMPSRRDEMTSLGHMVHRFKIDEEQRTVIGTSSIGGLEVVSVEDSFLWSLPNEEVSDNSHCEYDGGFLIFDRLDSNLEVWRRQRDSQSHPLPSRPDARQVAAARNASQSLTSIRQDNRGAFVPFMVISPTRITRAFRFVYPTLLVASQAGQEAYLYDVPTGQLIQRISLEVDADSRIEITYVELSARYVFVCTVFHGLLIFSRDPSACDPPFFRFHHEPRPAFSDAFDVYVLPQQWHFGTIGLRVRELPLQLRDDRQVGSQGTSSDICLAVHVSPCGSHLALATIKGFLVILRHFERTLRLPALPRHSITVICTRGSITNLAFQHDKIVIYASNWGILVVPFVWNERMDSVAGLLDIPRPRIYYAYQHSPCTEVFELDNYCSCVQMTQTGVWFAVRELDFLDSALQDPIIKVVRYIDFSRPPNMSHPEKRRRIMVSNWILDQLAVPT